MLSERDNYILNALSKIRHKKYELYVISRVLYTLNDPEIEFVCQQYVKTAKGRNFVDLYFPQFQIYLKINEDYHFKPMQRELDKFRDREILEAAKLKPYELNVFNELDGTLLPLNIVDQKISQFCDLIFKLKHERVAQGVFQPWSEKSSRYDLERYLNSKTIHVEDNILVRRQHHALRLFGADYKGWQRGWWQRNDTSAVWFPKLYQRRNSIWDNKLSEDGETITEQRLDGKAMEHQSNFHLKRIVFAHQRNSFGETVYKFLGVFESSETKSTSHVHVHKLISKELSLID